MMALLHWIYTASPKMGTFVARLRLQPEEAFQVADRDDENSWKGPISNLSVQLIGVGTIALIGTCIRVWAGMDVIQAQINSLVKSDNQQDERIENVRTEVNNLRIQVGIIRAQLGSSGLGRP